MTCGGTERVSKQMAKKSETKNRKAASTELIPTLWIGKSGVSTAIIHELRQQLKLRKKVKVKILKSALLESDRESIARELELSSGGQLVNLRGATAVFFSSRRVKNERKAADARQRK
jgi:RNA-binding protein